MIKPAFQMPGVALPPPPPVLPAINIADAVQRFRMLRDKRDALQKVHDDEMAPIKEEMGELQAILQIALAATGQTSARTEFGTVFTSTRRNYSIEDPAVFRNWVEAHGRPDFYENRASKDALDTYINDGHDLPPGVKVSTFTTVNIRK